MPNTKHAVVHGQIVEIIMKSYNIVSLAQDSPARCKHKYVQSL